MNKEVLKKVMKEHFIHHNEEATDSINFVMDLLEQEQNYIKKTEPQATDTIRKIKIAYDILRDLQDQF